MARVAVEAEPECVKISAALAVLEGLRRAARSNCRVGKHQVHDLLSYLKNEQLRQQLAKSGLLKATAKTEPCASDTHTKDNTTDVI